MENFREIFEGDTTYTTDMEDSFTEADINDVLTGLDEDDIQKIGNFIGELIEEDYELDSIDEGQFIKKPKVKKSASEKKKASKNAKEYRKKNKAAMKKYAKKAAKMKKQGKTPGGKKIRTHR